MYYIQVADSSLKIHKSIRSLPNKKRKKKIESEIGYVSDSCSTKLNTEPCPVHAIYKMPFS